MLKLKKRKHKIEKRVSFTVVSLLLLLAFSSTSLATWTVDLSNKSLECKKVWRNNQEHPRNECYKAWTVLVFMNGDNDLSPNSIQDIHEMETVGSSVSVDFVIQHDTSSDDGVKRYLLQKKPKKSGDEQSDDKSNINFASILLESMPELDSGNYKVFQDFLTWGFMNYPSKHQMVIIWSHGKGFSGGISTDYSSDTSISISELKKAITTASRDVLDGKPIDIYASDACLMQSLEVIYSIRDQARFIIGSSNLEEGRGWPYNRIFRDLRRNPYAKKFSESGGAGIDSAYRLAQDIPDLYIRSYRELLFKKKGRVVDLDATMTTVNAAQLVVDIPRNAAMATSATGFLPALYRFTQALTVYLQENSFTSPMIVGTSMDKSPDFGEESRDLYYFTAHLNQQIITNNPDSAFTRSQQNLLAAIEKVQYWLKRIELRAGVTKPDGAYDSDHKDSIYRTSGDALRGLPFMGLTLWMPITYEYYQRGLKFYSDSELLQKIGWLEMLEILYPADMDDFPL